MLINIDDIKINPGRRTAAPEDVQKLSESIAEVGMMNPVTVTADHTLVAGLHRLEAARVLGWAEIECRVIDMRQELADAPISHLWNPVKSCCAGRRFMKRSTRKRKQGPLRPQPCTERMMLL